VYSLHTYCRACGLGKPEIPTLKVSSAAGVKEEPKRLVPVVDLGLQPLANDFVNGSEERAGFAPLEVLLCPNCLLGQLSVEVDPVLLYGHNYLYVTSTSKLMAEHFQTIECDLAKECTDKKSVVEIGSNDGALLEYFGHHDWQRLLGIEPAVNLSEIAKARGVPTFNFFFDETNAKTIFWEIGHPSLILARHCFCHINDWRGFVKALEVLAGLQTVIAIEVPYAQDMLEHLAFDTIYHEHTSYLSLKSVQCLLKGTSFYLDNVTRYPIHGGSIMLLIKKRTAKDYEEHTRALKMIDEENISLQMWRTFSDRSQVNIMELGALVRGLIAQGQKVVGYGASAKSTVWINACGFTKREISFITDNTKGKWFRFSPGSDIPIVDEGALTRELPDYAICFAWNYFDQEIKEKEKIFREKGGKWIVPVPKIQIV